MDYFISSATILEKFNISYILIFSLITQSRTHGIGLYYTLGLPKGAPEEDVKKAYRKVKCNEDWKIVIEICFS